MRGILADRLGYIIKDLEAFCFWGPNPPTPLSRLQSGVHGDNPDILKRWGFEKTGFFSGFVVAGSKS